MRNSNTCLDRCLEKRGLFKWAGAAVALIFVASAAHAIDPNRMISQYMRDGWRNETGFPGGSVSAVAQTKDGYLWIGTDRGLIRFDGLNFRTFPQAIPESFPIGPVRNLVTDAEGNLWILLQSTKVLRLHNGKFELGREEAEFGVTAIDRRRDGAALFFSLAFGTLTYNEGKFRIPPSLTGALPNSGAGANAGAYDDLSSRLSWSTSVVSHHFAEPNSAVLAMAETSDGKVWLGTRDKGLFYLSDGKVSAAGKRTASAEISCLLALDKGELWIGTPKGLLRWDGEGLTSSGVPSVLRHAQVRAMIRDRDSNIWVGTSEGLVRVNRVGVSLDQGGGTSAPVTALFEDREGNLWVGSPGGIERLRDSAFVTYSTASLQSESGGPIYVDSDERAWFAPFKGGLHWLNGEQSGSVANDALNQDVVYSIAGSKNELWIGRQRGGLTHLLYSGDSITAKTYTQADGLAQNGVYAVYQSHDGSLWAATLSGGVSVYRNERFTTYTAANGLASNTVAAIAEGSDGTMWFGTPNGLNEFAKGQWHVFTVRDGMPADNVNCLLLDSTGTLWIGTASGLAFLKSGQVQVPDDAPPSLREEILGIAEDKNGRLWIATSQHVLSAKRDTLLSRAPGKSDVREYGLEDGLHGMQGVKRYRSVVTDSRGRVWFSMNRGLSVVDPERAVGISPPAMVQIEGLSADDTSIDLQQSVRIPAGSHRVTFNYSGLSLSIPGRVRFRYKLDGFDQNWSEPVSTRAAVYTNLKWGTYRFNVIASNSDGVWNEGGATVDFFIAPAWYQTNLFRVLCVVTGLLIAWAIYRLRVRQIASALSARFDERLAERTRVARELHDTFLQTIQGSKLVADDALEKSGDPVRLRRAMEQLSVWLGQATQEGRAALNSLRTSTTQRNDLAEALQRATEECRMQVPMEVSFSVVGEVKEMHPVVRDEVYRIGYEAIRNAYTHSGGSRLEVGLSYAHDLTVHVGDDGKGIDRAIAEKGRDGHFGLQGMRERAARIGGRLSVVSSAKSGTQITVVVPGRIVFRNASTSRFERLKAIFKRADRPSQY